MVNPLSYLHGAISQGGSYEQLLLKTLANVQNSVETPWNLVLYTDEVVPGNPLAVRLERKAHLLYFTFAEFGHQALANTAAWLTCGVHTSVSVTGFSAGLSQLVAKILKAFFCNEVCDVMDGGLVVKTSAGRLIRIYFQMGLFLQDGAAHKGVFCLKADSGCRFCMLCKNLFCTYSKAAAAEEAEAQDDEDDGLICAACKHSDMDLATDAEVLAIADRLQARARTCTLQELRDWETACGMNYEPHGLLLDPQLRAKGVLAPVSQFVHDGMHALASAGALQAIVFLLLRDLEAAGLSIYAMLEQYIGIWILPGGHAFQLQQLVKLFSSKKREAYKKPLLCLLNIAILFVLYICFFRGQS